MQKQRAHRIPGRAQTKGPARSAPCTPLEVNSSGGFLSGVVCWGRDGDFPQRVGDRCSVLRSCSILGEEAGVLLEILAGVVTTEKPRQSALARAYPCLFLGSQYQSLRLRPSAAKRQS
eukprot:gnl/TRDRNA2_/TRDRNA2_174261_c2_seq4.p1 gnl/TRDRNA2_/TRDRNA2_174261_c2~~gnl/TRDRNA2_/TRDRNA2_174261_c2_seq4.p1  ORF type:complete len:118 (-),score=0.12 gnl/TRDRNA2_/TRDRNA2_174261_c2_seq4:101-454(-)